MTYDIVVSFVILVMAIILFSTEKIRSDLTAILIMILLPWTNVITVEEAFSGLSSNAVITVIAVMIMGYGIEKSGAMDAVALLITQKAGNEENKAVTYISGTVGIISSFMQNIGAVALFLPVAKKISRSMGANSKKFLMPMGFAGILGGTLTMIASGPLIILNDLLGERGHDPFHLFSVTPVGLVLLGSGLLYFYFFRNFFASETKEESVQQEDSVLNLYQLPKSVYEIEITKDSPLIGKNIEEISLWGEKKIHILAIWDSDSITYSPWRKTKFSHSQRIAVFGDVKDIDKFCTEYKLDKKSFLDVFQELQNEEVAGFAEMIVPPKSQVKGKTLEEIALRKNFKVEPIIYISPEGERLECIERPLEAGLQIIVFGKWEDIKKIKDSRDFFVITDVRPVKEQVGKYRKYFALLSLALAMGLVIAGFSLPLSFLTGAMLMVASGAVAKDELYRAVDWRTVFLLAGLIPLGTAFEKSGAAALSADLMMGLISEWPVFLFLLVIGIVTSFFSLFMSNVAATVLLVPIVVAMSSGIDIDPRSLALLVAISASNSFIIPTHQVNAYIKTPGKYSNQEFIRAGSLMTIIFLVVSVTMIYFFYL